MIRKRFLLSVVAALSLLASTIGVYAADGRFDVTARFDGGPPDQMMRRYLLRQVDGAAERWKADYENRLLPRDIASYQESLRAKIVEAIGGFPERTPLEPRVVATVSRLGYRVDKVIFQSQPKHFVTALLFLPEDESFKPPYPGVLVPCGHSLFGKEFLKYQAMGALLAQHGMAALVFDPVEQGERGQSGGRGRYYAADGWRVGDSFRAHMFMGVGCVLLGRSLARFEVWDGMRAIDYLQSRPEIDPKRIGCTGNSGGGTQSSYLMALDDRIRAAAPACYLTSMPAMLHTFGPQDWEQLIYGQLAFGLDHADWIMLRAPSPVLMCTATKDCFDIEGAWDTFRFAKRLYSRLGYAERVDLVEHDGPHGWAPSLREGSARWMSRWLMQKDEAIVEKHITPLTKEECRCTPDGNVMSLPGARSVYDLNEDYERELSKRRTAAWSASDRTALLDEVRRLTGIRKLQSLPFPKCESLDISENEDYVVEKMLIVPEEGIVLPAVWIAPKKPNAEAPVLYLHDQGKSADAGPGGPIERLVSAGSPVLAVDVRGLGQTKPLETGAYASPEYQDAAMAYLLGRSYVGMRAEDIMICARIAAEEAGNGQKTVRLIAVGNVGIPALHAAALEPELFEHVSLSGMLVSWSSIIHRRVHRDIWPHLVNGALVVYDLPNLVAALGDKISVVHPVDGLGAEVEDK